MVHLYSIAAALAALPLVYGAGLNTAAKAKGLKYFGSATDNPELTDTTYVAQLSNTDDFGQITPGNSMKWDSTEPSRNSFSFANGDAVVNLATKNGQMMRCHTLVWHNQLPNWVSSGSWTNATLLAAMKNHITNVVTHYKGKCYAWDVVNEALNEDGTFRNSIFYQTIGEAYIPIAFATAAAADPSVKLYYNDYNIEYSGAKATAAQNIVKMIKAYGAKIDGVGLQAHFIVGSTPSQSDLTTVLKGYTALGVEVAYTELDIRMQLPSTDAKLAQQSNDFQGVAAACVSTAGCVGVTIWDWTDKYSWVPGVFSGYGAALPWNENYVKKPAYNGLMAGLGASGSTTTTTLTTTTKTTTTTGASSTGVAQKWGQCGGIGWNGPTTCVSGTTCQKQNDWYSQCL
ncbi:endo-1,4-beta-xylanase [Aspergillus udagawae]|uniref:Beta-xylanase n=1 Tax=Aspergillus udagawae TaxID=91492 RepID=A0ABQ1AAZ8_9EURO|nr:endo-1,4-beta-xylanase [Aspergillus udagawae]GFF77781.1 endo-1,4-beta-xylanase [Aspergillus udagawae]GFG07458.1 endo-1,4-beta-xylanase [Aspergillus udagawae]GFG22849.1 endo-1,4-beta-xylanase [Aspergillus udagawae]